MPAEPVAVLGTGLVSGVGYGAAACCAAIRCGTNNFQETRFIDADGAPLVGSMIPLEPPFHHYDKLVKLAAAAIAECLAASDQRPERIPTLLCVAEPERPGRFGGNAQALLHDIEQELGARLDSASRVLELGRVGGAVALRQARRFLFEKGCRRCVVAGVDTFLTEATLRAYWQDNRLLTRSNSNGFVPGEAAAAVLLGTATESASAPLVLRGLGFAREPAPFGSGQPLRADGLVEAVRAALDDAGIGLADCDHRIADLNGEQYRFKEASLAITRILRQRKVNFSLWHPADCIGEVGAATLPAMLAILSAGARDQYLPGQTVLGHLGNDDDKRAAFVARTTVPQPLALETTAETSYTLRRRSSL